MYRFDRTFTAKIPEISEWTDNRLPPLMDNIYYTDGSLIRDSAGAGIYCSSNETNVAVSLGEYASIFLAEIYAITASCHTIIQST